jgi:hypothetical protein
MSSMVSSSKIWPTNPKTAKETAEETARKSRPIRS